MKLASSNAIATATPCAAPSGRPIQRITGDSQRGQRDADLRAGQLERQRLVRLLDLLGPAVGPAADMAVHLASFQRGQGELGGHEDGGADGQNDDGENAEDVK
jgi:hypothetical protein